MNVPLPSQDFSPPIFRRERQLSRSALYVVDPAIDVRDKKESKAYTLQITTPYSTL